MTSMPIIDGREHLREWKAIHMDQTSGGRLPLVIEHLTGYHEDELFHNCVFKNVRGAHLHNCCLTESKFDIQNIEDMQDFTMGLDCAHFSNVELSDIAFDYVLLLLLRTKGNTAKRLAIIEGLGGKSRVSDLLNAEYPGNMEWER